MNDKINNISKLDKNIFTILFLLKIFNYINISWLIIFSILIVPIICNILFYFLLFLTIYFEYKIKHIKNKNI